METNFIELNFSIAQRQNIGVIDINYFFILCAFVYDLYARTARVCAYVYVAVGKNLEWGKVFLLRFVYF